MKVITKDNSSTELHSVHSKKKPAVYTKKPHQQQTEQGNRHSNNKTTHDKKSFKPKTCFRYGGKHG